MRYCKDCHRRVQDYELFCPRCSADLYSRPRVRKAGLLEDLAQFKGNSR